MNRNAYSPKEYIAKFKNALIPGIRTFQPQIIFWEFGYDATSGEYGDKGISPDCHLQLLKLMKHEADSICGGKLVCILCGGSSRRLAAYIIPGLIEILAER